MTYFQIYFSFFYVKASAILHLTNEILTNSAVALCKFDLNSEKYSTSLFCLEREPVVLKCMVC